VIRRGHHHNERALLAASMLTGLLLAMLTVHRTGLWFVGH